MTRRFALRFAVAVVTIAAFAARAGESTKLVAPPPIPDGVSVTIRAVETPIGGASDDVASAGPVLAIGESGSAYLLTGGFDAEGREVRRLCVSSVGSGSPPQDRIASALNVWRATFKVVSATMESIVLSVDWSRETATRPGPFERAAGGSTTVTLREDERHTLDFLAARDSGDRCGESLRIDIAAAVREDPRFAKQRIAYDLWLLDEVPGRRPETRRFQAVGRQGERLDFSFAPLRWAIPGVRLADGRGVETIAEIDGTIRGRLREDGSIDVLLEGSRRMGAAKAGDEKTGGIGDGGKKTLRLSPDETLALVFPAPGPAGSYTLGLDGTWASTHGAERMTSFGESFGPASGVELTSKSVTVNFSRFLADHKMSLRLTARPEPR